jgi:hypothetical protein
MEQRLKELLKSRLETTPSTSSSASYSSGYLQNMNTDELALSTLLLTPPSSRLSSSSSQVPQMPIIHLPILQLDWGTWHRVISHEGNSTQKNLSAAMTTLTRTLNISINTHFAIAIDYDAISSVRFHEQTVFLRISQQPIFFHNTIPIGDFTENMQASVIKSLSMTGSDGFAEAFIEACCSDSWLRSKLIIS